MPKLTAVWSVLKFQCCKIEQLIQIWNQLLPELYSTQSNCYMYYYTFIFFQAVTVMNSAIWLILSMVSDHLWL